MYEGTSDLRPASVVACVDFNGTQGSGFNFTSIILMCHLSGGTFATTSLSAEFVHGVTFLGVVAKLKPANPII